MVHAVVCSAGMINSSSAAVSRRVNVASNAFLPITRIPRRRCMLVTATAAPQMQQQSKSPFSMVQSEADLFNILKMGQSKGQVPERLIASVDELYTNYKTAVIGSGVDGATEQFVARVMASVCERVLLQLTPEDAYTFPSYHQRILEPYNYFEFGQRYIRGLVDFQNSRLGHIELFAKVRDQLAAGENVVLLANHQTEADPAVFALLLEAEFPELATEVIYVAGDRVVTDALCKPFSMGRNLFCVHSKKHLDDIPELKAEKQATNRRTLKAMQSALNEGGKLLWIAPSGGRDRSLDPENGDFLPDRFDPSAVELMRALVTKAKPAGHLYPFAMYSAPIMPPPKSVEKSIGERRLVFYSPVGISLCEELDADAIVAGIEDKEERQKRLADTAWESVLAEYKELYKATKAGGSCNKYTQPWLKKELPSLDAW